MTNNRKKTELNAPNFFDIVEAVIFDFDGVFTDNRVLTTEGGIEAVSSWRGDGIGLDRIRQLGLYAAVVSTEKNKVVTTRCQKLKLPVFQGVNDKKFLLKSIIEQEGFDPARVIYVGNDLNDLECMRFVGLPVAIIDSPRELLDICVYETRRQGGYGAVREVCDLVFEAKTHNSQGPLDKAHLDKKRPVAQFPKEESVGPRDWGEEILLVLSSGKYTMKKLIVNAGKKGGLQYHRFKDEASYIVSGEMLLRYEDELGKLVEKKVGPGDWFHFPAGCVHQEEAITDVVRIEVSTPHFNDRVRVEHEFGIGDKEGLPTTSIDEVEKR